MEHFDPPAPRLFRFGPFELDTNERELRKGGTPIRLGNQPFEILRMLIERRGATVMREEIQLRLWPNDTIVEFDLSINAAVRQLRMALRDSAEKPRYVETVARRGYRFLAEVEEAGHASPAPVPAPVSDVETFDPHSLTGRTISHFRVIEKLGAGGMGVVYRAEDLQLGRQVALKFLPCPIEDLPDLARQRFEREARALASLRHPHICAVLGLESIAGQPVIEMELLEGETLAARLRRGPMTPAEALPLVIQMAGAVAEAHSKGFVHRDLKPANIMLTDSGVKMLDFGLVKVDRTSVAGDETLTIGGTLLGTPHYMSPEQAQGKETDRRSDIFSFGVVLYETLTGQKAFQADTPAGAIAAILEREPPRLSSGASGWQMVLDRCLARNPEDRWQSAGDLKASLELLAETPSSGAVVARPGVPGATGRGVRPVVWIGAAALVLAGIVIAALWLRDKPADKPVVRFNIGAPGKEAHIYTGLGTSVAVSPDGRRVVFGAVQADGRNRLWVRSLDKVAAQPLAGTEDARYPFWSPDSRMIGFGADGKLKKIDVQGGPVVTLADAAFLRGAAWNRGGVIVFVPGDGTGQLRRVAAAGGASTPLTPRLLNPRAPWFLPDGRHFLFAVGASGGHLAIHVGSLDSQEAVSLEGKVLLEADSNAIYAGGQLLFLREATLMAQPFDPQRLAVTGDAVSLGANVLSRVASAVGFFSASENGTLVYAPGDRTNLTLTWMDRGGKRLSTLGDPGPVANIHFSPDRRSAAVTIADHANADIWIYDLLRGIRTRFTFDPAREKYGVWSPDSRSIAFYSDRKGHPGLYRKPSNGTGPEELLYANDLGILHTSWSPDGRFLLYHTGAAGSAHEIWVLPMPKAEVRAPLKPYPWMQAAEFQQQHAQFSPDGRWVAYQSNESGRYEICLAPFPGPGVKQQVSGNGGILARWRQDGKEIFFIGTDQKLRAVAVKSKGSALELGEERPLFGSLLLGDGYLYDVSADGQRFLAAVPPEEETQELTVIQNWAAGLKK